MTDLSESFERAKREQEEKETQGTKPTICCYKPNCTCEPGQLALLWRESNQI